MHITVWLCILICSLTTPTEGHWLELRRNETGPGHKEIVLKCGEVVMHVCVWGGGRIVASKLHIK